MSALKLYLASVDDSSASDPLLNEAVAFLEGKVGITSGAMFVGVGTTERDLNTHID